LTVNPTPAKPTISVNGNVLTSSATSGNQWYLEGASINGATGQTNRVQASGQYTVKVTQGNCEAISDAYHFVATRVEGPASGNSSVSVYPNPVVKTLSIKNNAGHQLQWQLYNSVGVRVWQGKVQGSQTSIDVQHLAVGVYQLVIYDVVKRQTMSQTIVKL
jgi:hypothetical protein